MVNSLLLLEQARKIKVEARKNIFFIMELNYEF